MINKIMLVGTVKSEPITRGAAISFRMSTWRIIQDGRRFDTTHTVEAFGRNGEAASQFKVGELVCVEGSIKHSSYEKNGQKVWFTCVSASSVGRAGEEDKKQPAPSTAPAQSHEGSAPATYPPNQPQQAASGNSPEKDDNYGF
jgi:single-stranded DNA-binding protein